MNFGSLVSLLRPYKPTTEETARQAMLRCGLSPDEIAWEVGEDGALVFGMKHPDAQTLSVEQFDCLIAWARRERVKLRFIGWEAIGH
jgi:hypothetical protein